MKKTTNKTGKKNDLKPGEKTIIIATDILSQALVELLQEAAKKEGYTIECVVTDVVFAKAEEKKSVPTTDNIKIPKKIVDECRESVASSLSLSEKKQIVTLRREGKTIKEIAKAIHRRDRTVSAFLRHKK